MAANLCLPVVKLSYATGVRADNTVPYEHLLSSELAVIVKGEPTNSTLVFRIIERSSILESLDVGRHVDMAIDKRRSAQQAGITLSSEQLPIYAVRKNASFGIKFYLPDRQARRLQLQMRNPNDCQQVLGVLQSRGMEVCDQRPRTGRPDTASLDRLLTANSNAPRSDASLPDINVSPFVMPPMEAGSLSEHRPSSPARVHSPSCSTSTYSGTYESRSSGLPPSIRLPHNEYARQAAEPSRPTNIDVCWTTLKDGAQGDTLGASTEIRDVNPAANPEQKQSSSSLDYFTSHSSITLTSPTRSQSPTMPPFPETLEHEIPPRRELPFKRPASRPKSRPHSSALELPPLQKPQLAKEGYAQKRSLEVFDEEARGESLAVNKPYLLNRAPTQEAVVVDRVVPALSPMEALLARQRPLMERADNSKVPRMSSLLDAPFEIDSPPRTATKPPQHAAPQQTEDTAAENSIVRSSLGKKPPTTHGEDGAALDGYVLQSREDRMAALDEFMMSKLNDESFKALCRDIETCWRRTALGL